MRLLLTTYHQAFLAPAGGETELRQLREIIDDQGVRADLYGPQSKRLGFYDAVIHFSAHGGGEGLLRDIKQHGTPIVLIPNFNFFIHDHSAHAVVQRHLDLADVVVLRTEAERRLCLADFTIAPERTAVVPAGISRDFAVPAEPDLFRSAYGLERFLLWVGQIEPQKQQLRAIEELAGLPVPLVFIGGYADRDYYERCKAAADESVRFLPFLQPNSEIIRSAMQSCDAYLELGADYPGFSVLEAALAGAPLVLNDHPWSREVLGDAPYYVAADQPGALRAAIDDALRNPSRGGLVDAIKEMHVQPGPTRKLLEIVQALVGAGPHSEMRGGQARPKSSVL